MTTAMDHGLAFPHELELLHRGADGCLPRETVPGRHHDLPRRRRVARDYAGGDEPAVLHGDAEKPVHVPVLEQVVGLHVVADEAFDSLAS